MPAFTININATQAARVASAFSFLNEDGSNATGPQVQAWLLRQMRAVVRKAESRIATTAADAQVDIDLEADGWVT